MSDADDVIVNIPDERDILLGSGHQQTFHAGNIYYRDYIDELKTPYKQLKLKERGLFCLDIVHHMTRERNARFLQYEYKVKGWKEVNESVAKQKVMEKLRHSRPGSVTSNSHKIIIVKEAGIVKGNNTEQPSAVSTAAGCEAGVVHAGIVKREKRQTRSRKRLLEQALAVQREEDNGCDSIILGEEGKKPKVEGDPKGDDGENSTTLESMTLQSLSALKAKWKRSEGSADAGANPSLPSDEQEDGTKSGECPNCKKTFSSKNGLRYHMEKGVCQQATDAISCPLCNKSFVTERMLTRHLDNKICQRRPVIKNTPNKNDKPVRKKRATPKKDAKTNSLSSTPIKKEDPGKRRSSRTGSSAKKSPQITVDDESDASNNDSDANTKMNNKGGKKSRNNRVSIHGNPTDILFHKLKPGSKYISRFGIVKVIADDRMPAEIPQLVSIDTKVSRNHQKMLVRFGLKKMRVVDKIADGTRYRREELKKMYLESDRSSTCTSITQEKVWGLYCQTITPKQILTEGKSWGHGKIDLQSKKTRIDTIDGIEDPHFPKDCYPDRIVECELVNDDREVVDGTLSGDFRLDDPHRARHVEFHTQEKPVFQKQTVPMRLFIARKELTQEYQSSNPCYICDSCGRRYSTTGHALTYHMSNQLCVTKKVEDKAEREDRITRIDGSARLGHGSHQNLLTTTHGPVKAHSKDAPPDFGNPWRIKEFKKHKMPPWLVFNPQRSSMYPEIYQNLNFRRGSQNRNHYNKKKQDDGYVPYTEISRLRKLARTARVREARKKELAAKIASAETERLLKQLMENPGAKESDESKDLIQPDLIAAKVKEPEPTKKIAFKKTKMAPKQSKKKSPTKEVDFSRSEFQADSFRGNSDLPGGASAAKEKPSERAKPDAPAKKEKQQMQTKKKLATNKEEESKDSNVSGLSKLTSAALPKLPEPGKKAKKKPATKKTKDAIESNQGSLPADLPPLHPTDHRNPMDMDIDFGQNDMDDDDFGVAI